MVPLKQFGGGIFTTAGYNHRSQVTLITRLQRVSHRCPGSAPKQENEGSGEESRDPTFARGSSYWECRLRAIRSSALSRDFPAVVSRRLLEHPLIRRAHIKYRYVIQSEEPVAC
jgi:hypothetical protein